MIRRVASHYIFWKEIFRMHYVELEDGILRYMAPLKGEIASTEFYNGMVVIVPAGQELPFRDWKEWSVEHAGAIIEDWLHHTGITHPIAVGDPVDLYHIDLSPQATAELCTHNSGGNSYIQRL